MRWNVGVNELADERRRRDEAMRYPSGYVSSYDGNAARKLERVEEEPIRKSRERRQRRVKKKLDLAVREPGKIAPTAVAGMVVACLMAMVMLNQYAALMVINDEAVELKNQLESLKEEEAKLLTLYELAYDLQAIEDEFLGTGQMMKPQSGQIYTISLPEQSQVVHHEGSGFGGGLFSGIQEIFSAIGTYF